MVEMGLITKEVEVNLDLKNLSYYINFGYDIDSLRRKDKQGRMSIPKGTKIKIKVEDLPKNSNVYVHVKCDSCGKDLYNTSYQNYNNYLKDDGKYYCRMCSKKLFGYEKGRITRLKNGENSFKQWCIKNLSKKEANDVLSRWDYDLNKINPNEINYSTHLAYYFKCPNNLHESELIEIVNFTSKHGRTCCIKCNSFAQWGINNLGKDFLRKYWDLDKNNVDPWKISYGYSKKIYIKCQEKDYHGSYLIDCISFIEGSRCSYCSSRGGKIHPLDSLGQLLKDIQLLNIWSIKNKKSPYEYSINSGQDVWWSCPEGKHKDYRRKISNSNSHNFRCSSCTRERDESFLQEKVRLYLNKLGYMVLHELNCNIVAQNPKVKNKRGRMPYDNEVIELKLIIEVHGSQHYDEVHGLWFDRGFDLYKQQLYDRYKRMFAKFKGYEYLEIPYWTENDEFYKYLIDNKINEILYGFKKEVNVV
jgi:hypothetical protein